MKQVKIDGKKLRRMLKNAGFENMAQMSRDMGLGRNYLATATKSDSIADLVMNEIERKTGIRYEDVRRTEETKQQIADAPDDTFFRCMYKAVYAAVTNALRDAKTHETES